MRWARDRLDIVGRRFRAIPRAAWVALGCLLVVTIVAGALLTRQQTVSGNGPAKASAACGDFQLQLDLPRTSWHVTEAVEGTATLRYLGSGIGHWSGSGMGPVGFEYRQVDGRIDVVPVWTADLVVHDVPAASPLLKELAKSGSFDNNDPLASFYAGFFKDPAIHLPAGEWGISAVTDHGCADAGAPLRATVRIRILP